jgi:hypothetical protein
MQGHTGVLVLGRSERLIISSRACECTARVHKLTHFCFHPSAPSHVQSGSRPAGSVQARRAVFKQQHSARAAQGRRLLARPTCLVYDRLQRPAALTAAGVWYNAEGAHCRHTKRSGSVPRHSRR